MCKKDKCFLQNAAAIDKEAVKTGYYCPLCGVEQMEGHRWHYWYFGRVPNRPPPEEAEPWPRLPQRLHPRPLRV